MRVNAFGLPVSDSGQKTRIKQDHRKKKFYHLTFESEFKEDAPKNLIVMYDIPHEKKKD